MFFDKHVRDLCCKIYDVCDFWNEINFTCLENEQYSNVEEKCLVGEKLVQI